MSKHFAHSHQVAAKLILCGEHAVLYGVPALSLAIKLPTECTIDFLPVEDPKQPLTFRILLPDVNIDCLLGETQWIERIAELESRYPIWQQDRDGALLQSPEELILLCLMEVHRQHPLPKGHWRIQLQSDNLIGRGMGSSAAVILATLGAVAKTLQVHFNKAQLLRMATAVEHYQHGRSSGLDPATLLENTVIEYQLPAQIRPLGLKQLPMQAWLIDSGQAQSTTAECVQQVRQNFAEDQALWQHFAKVVRQIKHAWQSGNLEQFRQGIRQNQLLLEQIGVVPQPVIHFIQALGDLAPESCAKVCGAGSVRGNAAGILVYFADKAPTALCAEYGYRCQPLDLFPNPKSPV
ncbi:MAG: hypothetical protein JXR44_00335 [Thiotrichales bacterium]|nr:hypothetical protein [Thiotrichales bacterium]